MWEEGGRGGDMMRNLFFLSIMCPSWVPKLDAAWPKQKPARVRVVSKGKPD